MKVRYYGHVDDYTGYGVAARAMCHALLAAGLELEIRSLSKLTTEGERYEGPARALAQHMRLDPELTDPDVVIVHTLPTDCARVFQIVTGKSPDMRDVPWIAYTTWETTQMPAFVRDSLQMAFVQVWTPSRRSLAAISTSYNVIEDPALGYIGSGSMAHTRVLVVPHAYDVDAIPPPLARTGTRPFRFLYVGAWSARKNPEGLLRAFAYADFEGGEAELWMHSAGTPQETFAVAHVSTGCHATMAKVRFLPEHLDDHLLHQQYQAADCFVTASRGEAWNLPAFEAMLHGRHIITPSGLGSDDFLDDTSAAFCHECQRQPAQVDAQVTSGIDGGVMIDVRGAQGVSARCSWRDPDLIKIGHLMREAVLDHKRTLRVHYNPADRYSYSAVGTLALKILENV